MPRLISTVLMFTVLTFGSSVSANHHYSCDDMISVSRLVAGGQNWNSAQKAYVKGVMDQTKEQLSDYLGYLQSQAGKGDTDAQMYLSGLYKLGFGQSLSLSDLALKVIQRIHLADQRVQSLDLNFSQCIGYGVGALVGTTFN